MAKVLLIMPSLLRKTSVPYLGQQYLASSLMRDGHEVRCLDLAAVRFPEAPGEDIRVVESWQPDMIGVTLFTQNALAGYRLAKKLKGRTRLLLAGGPHPTACPEEPLRFGFEAVARGEGEQAVVAYARGLDAGGTGMRIPDLDALPFPVESLGCYDASSYSEKGVIVPGGMITSIANFMFGFPGEGVDELDRTLRFMEEISDVADMFNHGGVLVPYPGTEIYDRNHSRYGFTDWWLDPRYLPDEPDLFEMDPDRAQQYLERDGILDLDFFRYTVEVREKIAGCVRFKARHNQRYVEKCRRARTA
jgi:radical SAM superfamily enzyme YgiQ (UPF0313 family)